MRFIRQEFMMKLLDSDETGEKISKETDEKTREKTSIETR